MNDSAQKKDVISDGSISALEIEVWNALKLCYDPEIPVNVADLGLIYGVELVLFESSNSDYEANIRMTLTTAGCPMSDFIVDEIKNRVGALSFVKKVNVELVFDPPWERSMMSMQAKLELGML